MKAIEYYIGSDFILVVNSVFFSLWHKIISFILFIVKDKSLLLENSKNTFKIYRFVLNKYK